MTKEKKTEITIVLTTPRRLVITGVPVVGNIEDIIVIAPYNLEISTGIELVGQKELSFFENTPEIISGDELPDTWYDLPAVHADALRALHTWIMEQIEAHEGLEDPK